MRRILLFIILCPQLLFTQIIENGYFYNVEKICEDFTELYIQNPNVKNKIYVYGGVQNIKNSSDYIFIGTTVRILRFTKDGTRVDSLLEVAYIPGSNSLSPVCFRNGILSTFQFDSNRLQISDNYGNTWEQINFGKESGMIFSKHFDKNHFIGGIRDNFTFKSSHILLMTRDGFNTIDTIDLIKSSKSEYLYKKDFRGHFKGYGQNELTIFFAYFYNEYDSIVTSKIIDKIYGFIVTEDGGLTWTNYPLETKSSFLDIYQFGDTLFSPGKKYPLTNASYTKGAGIKISTNMGKTWQHILDTGDSVNSVNILQFDMINSQRMIFSSSQGKIFFTLDGGKKWIRAMNEELFPNTGLWNGIIFESENVAYLLDLYDFYRVELTAPTSIEDYSNTLDYLLKPNPAHDFVEIKSNTNQFGECCIYNIYGEILMKENIISSNHKIDITKLIPGIYFIAFNNVVNKFVKI